MSIETIAAIATPPGRGGVGIVRISGPKVVQVAEALLGEVPEKRIATLTPFLDQYAQPIDEGIALYFKAPYSFTGEDVLELQGHGGPVIMDILLKRVLECGVRMAQPGEFSQRAFLNDKLDLVQAEAIADLIDASSEQAARSAVRSLQGEFSRFVNQVLERLTQLRMYVEAAIDFPEEEIDFLSDRHITDELSAVIQEVESTLSKAQQGALLQEGMTVVIAGKPNAGKSSLLNALSGRDSAIVTDIAGTTRDVLKEHISLDGLPLHVIDTAGLRDSNDVVEQEGVRRAWQAIENADVILLMVDGSKTQEHDPATLLPTFFKQLKRPIPIVVVHNKIDVTQESAEHKQYGDHDMICLSAKTGNGVDLLKSHLKSCVGFHENEGRFTARRRHLDALTQTLQHLKTGEAQLHQHRAGELLAEDLRQAQQALTAITGAFTSDDLLGVIFSSFCIGK